MFGIAYIVCLVYITLIRFYKEKRAIRNGIDAFGG